MKSSIHRWLVPAVLLAAVPLVASADGPEASTTAPATPADVRQMQQGQTVAFVGIGTGPVEPALASHLSIAEGMGLIVQLVVKDSPAANAGILTNDVLMKFDDQLLVNTAQLTALIHMKEPGASVSFTLIRKGAEQVVEVELSEQTLQPPTMLRLLDQDGRPLRFDPMEVPFPDFEVRNQEIVNAMEAELARLREDLGENHPQMRNARLQLRHLQNRKAPDALGAPFVADGAAVVSDRNSDGTAATLTRDRAGLRFQYKQNGEIVFDGAVETDEQRALLTDEQRARLESLLEMMPTFEPAGPEANRQPDPFDADMRRC